MWQVQEVYPYLIVLLIWLNVLEIILYSAYLRSLHDKIIIRNNIKYRKYNRSRKLCFWFWLKVWNHHSLVFRCLQQYAFMLLIIQVGLTCLYDPYFRGWSTHIILKKEHIVLKWNNDIFIALLLLTKTQGQTYQQQWKMKWLTFSKTK